MKKIKKWINRIGEEKANSSGKEFFFAGIGSFLPAAETTLAVGCGDGLELSFLPGRTRGIDINQRNKKEGLIDIGDMHDLPYKDNAFELVFCQDTFEHAVAPIVALEEMTRVARAWVCIVLPDELWTEHEWHLIIPTDRQMIWLAECCGLSLVKRRDLRQVVNQRFLAFSRIFLFEK